MCFFELITAINVDIIEITLETIPAIDNTKILYISQRK